MKRSQIFHILLALAVVSAVVLTVRAVRESIDKEAMRPDLTRLGARAEKEEEDDPQKRLSFDELRFGDPRTGMVPADMRRRELAYAERLPAREQANDLLRKNGSASQALTSVWKHRGPRNVGGRTRALAVDRTNASVILAGGVSGGMWRTTDGGVHWTKATDLQELQSVTCVAQDVRPGKTATWYYGTGELVGNSASRGGAAYRGDGVFKSTDNGASWTRLASTASYAPQRFDAPWDYVWQIVTDPSKPTQDVVYAATIGAVMRSTDGGATWSVVLGGTTENAPRYTHVAIDPSGVLYASMSDENTNAVPGALQSGLWRSADGINWKNITPPGFPSSGFKRFVIAISPSRPSDVYFLGETPGAGLNGHSLWKYTYLSGDGTGPGGMWENRSRNLPNQKGLEGNAEFDSQGSYDLVCAVKPDDPSVVFIGGVNLYRSGTAFADTVQTVRIGGYQSPSTYALYPTNHPDHHALAFDPLNTSRMFDGNDGGVFRTENALAKSVSWFSLNNGYYNTQFYTVSIDHVTQTNTIIGGTQDNGTWLTRSLEPDAPWEDVFGGDGAYCAIASNSNSFFVSSQNGNAYRFIVDQTNTVVDYANITPSGGTDFLFINPFYLDPTNPSRVYLCGGSMLWRNNDITQIPTYTKSPSTADEPTRMGWDSLAQTRTRSSVITAAAVSTVPANMVYYGTSAGAVSRIDHAEKGDPPVIDISSGKGLPSTGFVNNISVNPENGLQAMVVYSNYNIQSLFATKDGGATWTAVGGNLEEHPDGSGNGPSVRCAAIVPLGTQTVYLVGTSVGLFSTTALEGASTVWVKEGADAIGSLPVDMIDWRQSDHAAVVATHGGGVFSATIAAGSDRLPGGIPNTFVLQQNYPNPFNPETFIRYTIPVSGMVRLNVYDGNGRLVAGLVNQSQEAGTYQVRWDGRAASGAPASSGAYFARLEQAGRTQTMKMILQR